MQNTDLVDEGSFATAVKLQNMAETKVKAKNMAEFLFFDQTLSAQNNSHLAICVH